MPCLAIFLAAVKKSALLFAFYFISYKDFPTWPLGFTDKMRDQTLRVTVTLTGNTTLFTRKRESLFLGTASPSRKMSLAGICHFRVKGKMDHRIHVTVIHRVSFRNLRMCDNEPFMFMDAAGLNL